MRKLELMDNWQPTTLSWSYSRKGEFDTCRRQYFYNRFWGQEKNRTLKWKLFEMRSIVTLAMLRGQVAHTVISDALRAIRQGNPVSIDSVRKSITEVIQPRYMESKKRLWHIDNRPKDRKSADITNLLEHYYNFEGVDERAIEARDATVQCVTNLMGSELWHSIAGSDAEQWNEIDDDKAFNCFDLSGIQVYARVDLAHSCGGPNIIDWKTGTPGERDRRQLILYSLYAQSKWGWEPEETTLTAVYLHPEFRLDAFKPGPDEIEAVRAEVKQSFEQMMELEPAFGDADISLFAETENKALCRWCRFQGACGAKTI